MPFYDLRCKSCGAEFNILAKVEDKLENSIPCPDCGGRDLAQLFKAAHFQLKHDEAPACPHSENCGAGCCHQRH